MNKKTILKWTGIGIGVIVIGVYALFLILPIFLSGVLNSKSGEIAKMVKDASGFDVKLEKMRVLTTPKLTAGFKVGHAEVSLPTGEKILDAEGFQLKMSLLPLLARKIEIDKVSVEKVNADIVFDKLIPPTPTEPAAPSQPMAPLPFGLKLSNRLPDITVNNYDVLLENQYEISGHKVDISDFVFNKKVKISADGSFKLKDRTQFNYDVKVLNKIMPDIDLNTLVFAPGVTQEAAQNQPPVDIKGILDDIYELYLTADVKTDIKVSGNADDPQITGMLDADNISLAVNGARLPQSTVKMKFSGDKIDMDTELYTAQKELTKLIGNFKTGKSPKIDLTCKSNATLTSIITIAKSVAQTFGINDLNTLSANGALDADFNLKSDLKNLKSSGHLNLASGNLAYGLYDVAVDNINANVLFNDNSINIKDSGFSIAGYPLKISGTVNDRAEADINLIAQKLQIKGLLAALGQMQLLKENDFRSGDLSFDVSVKGRLDQPKIKADVAVSNLNVKNIPANIAVAVPDTQIQAGDKDIDIKRAYVILGSSRVDITGKIADYMTNKINFDIKAVGNMLAADMANFMPPGTVLKSAGSLPLDVAITGNDKAQDISVKMTATPSNYLTIVDSDLLAGKNTLINSDIKIANDTAKLENTGLFIDNLSNPLVNVKGSIVNLSKTPKLSGFNVSTVRETTISIPGVDDGKALVNADINLSGAADNPAISGTVTIPSVTMPAELITVSNILLNINSPNSVVITGRGTVANLKSGGVTATNLSGDFSLRDNIVYITNIAGDCFAGKLGGSASYGLADGKVGAVMTGTGMDAEAAIAGGAGIKNALSGKLGWNANVNLQGATYEEQMKTLTGKVSFNIDDGTFGNIGRFENYLLAENLMNNVIIKTALAGVTALPAIKNASEFKTMSGDMTFSNGWANLSPIKVSGPATAYYITGQYQLLNGSANLVILGRLAAETVALLGPLGDLSVDKLTSYIPTFGTLTGSVIGAMTEKAASTDTSVIPQLSSGNTKYKDFKVNFNGGVESKSSVKSFKWLSNLDPADIQQMNIQEQVQSVKDTVQQMKDTGVQNVTTGVQNVKEQAQNVQQQAQDVKQNVQQNVQDVKQQLQNTKQQVQDLKNLFKN